MVLEVHSPRSHGPIDLAPDEDGGWWHVQRKDHMESQEAETGSLWSVHPLYELETKYVQIIVMSLSSLMVPVLSHHDLRIFKEKVLPCVVYVEIHLPQASQDHLTKSCVNDRASVNV